MLSALALDSSANPVLEKYGDANCSGAAGISSLQRGVHGAQALRVCLGQQRRHLMPVGYIANIDRLSVPAGGHD